ncbi:hypothetical protein ACV3J7_07180 [Salmonella enterica]
MRRNDPHRLTDERLLQRLYQFDAAHKEAVSIGDIEFAQECADVACIIREAQERRAADNAEPIGWIIDSIYEGSNGKDIDYYEEDLQNLPAGTRVYAVPNPVVRYTIGEATMRHIFTPAGLTDVSDMQAVFDRVECVLASLESKPGGNHDA